LYYLKEFQKLQTPPKNLLDTNIAPDYFKLKQMFQVVNLSRNQEVLEKVLQNDYIDTELVTIFNFERGFTQTDFVNFLAYLGNLTIDCTTKSNMVRFKIPNRVIQQLYWAYYADYLETKAELENREYEIRYAVHEMAEYSKYEPFFNLVQDLLQRLSNRDYQKFNEKYVKLAILAYLSISSIYDIRSEREVVGGGYVDIQLFRKSSNPNEHHEYVIELKYLKKEQEEQLNEVKEEAKKQLLNYYNQDTMLQSKPYLHLLAVVCVKDTLHVEEIKL
ncbi:MAG: PD-(D/E)XK nuclease domain-containing protein, partial [Bacteroidia bacterium]|nr:PD-(D/E)XK nuclease domain-containing protein [Bacteroidia bacterium]